MAAPSARITRTVPAPDPPWQVYVLECADRSLYTGIARDVVARVERHNRGLGARYTRGRLPVKLVYVEPAADRGAALRREYAIKQLTTGEKRTLVSTDPKKRPRRSGVFLGPIRR